MRGITITRLLRPPRRYDVVLAAIPATIGLAVLVAAVAAVPVEGALLAGALLAAVAIVDVVALHPPGRRGGRGPTC